MKTHNKSTFAILTSLFLMAVVLFGSYWFTLAAVPNNFTGKWHIIDWFLFALVSYIVWLPIVMKILFMAIVSHIRDYTVPRPKPGYRVAMVTTFVPASESIGLLHKTLPAMVNVSYPHDTWLLDEGNDPDVKAVCEQYGVRHFSRWDKPHYNAIDGKFARKTKGGNHNSWYDTIGNDYDIVAQMDTDFVPRDNFLERTLGFFNDPKIAFVGTPQIYGNIGESLIAKGAAEQTYSFYGPLLRGMAGMETTMLIGANHVIRVAALKQVDHYSAHITEDLLTGMKLHANGWKSVYVPEALAIGEGPVTWNAYFAQQKRWAYGCMHILLHHSFKLFRNMTMRRAMYYFTIQQHYFSGLAMFLSVICLLGYYAFGILTADTDLEVFLATYGSVVLLSVAITLWSQRYNVRPKQERGMLWAGMYIGIVAWPIYFNAFITLLKSQKLTYKVTPKGKKARKKEPMPLLLFAPHVAFAVIAIICLVSSLFTGRTAVIMQFWAGVSSLMLFVPFMPNVAHAISRLKWRKIDNYAATAGVNGSLK